MAPLLALSLALAAPARAEPRVAVRSGEHQGFGRLVLDARDGPAPAVRLTQAGDRLLVTLAVPGTLDLRPGTRPPRNATGLAATPEGLAVTLRSPEVRVRQSVLGARLVLDLLDPARAQGPRPAADAPATPRPAAAPVPQPRPAVTPPAATPDPAATPARGTQRRNGQPPREAPAAPVPAAAPPPPAAPREEPPPPPAPAPRSEQPAAAPPGAVTPAREERPPTGPAFVAPDLAAAPVALPPPNGAAVRLVFGAPGQPRAVVLPFGEETGIALLRRGEAVLVVLDTARPLNLGALRGDPVFNGMEARQVPGGTVLTLRLAEPGALVARRRDGAWALTAAPAAPPAEPAQLEAVADGPGRGVLVRTQHANRVLALPDPETGLPLLVGTVKRSGPTLSHARRLPEGDLLPGHAGIATLARSDRFALRVTPEGFVVSGALALDPAVAGPEPAQAMTRLFDIQSLPAAPLRDRLRSEHAAVRAAPPLARGPLRQAAAETLMALGMPQEAQAMLGLAAAEDPRAQEDPVMAALAGAAALLAGRLAEAEVLARADLPERDETILWRAMLDAARGDATGAAPRLAATLPLALAYPEALRARVIGPVAEALAEAGHAGGLKQLVAAGPAAGGAQGFAEAALAEAEGRAPAAIAAYAKLAESRDRQLRARALRRGIELRLGAGEIDAAKAADALEAALFAWRGDLQEISARRRVAALRLQAGDPQGAMAMLRETATLFPEQAPPLQPALQEAFLALLERQPPLAAVAAYDAEPTLLPVDARGDAALLAIGDRLAALDLPGRAVALLRPAMQRAVPGSARRAELGLRLARLQLEDGQAEAALAALRESQADALPAELGVSRGLLGARAEAQSGRRDTALAMLRGLGPAGAEPLAELLAETQDWAASAQALGQHLAAWVPPGAEPLPPEQARLVLRQAALLGLAADSAGLSALAARYGPRMGEGPLADAFAALTADPGRGLADLPRLQRELRLFRALPARVEAPRAEPVRAASLGTR